MDNGISRLLKSDIAGPIIPPQYTKSITELNHLVIVITFMLAQSDPIEW